MSGGVATIFIFIFIRVLVCRARVRAGAASTNTRTHTYIHTHTAIHPSSHAPPRQAPDQGDREVAKASKSNTRKQACAIFSPSLSRHPSHQAAAAPAAAPARSTASLFNTYAEADNPDLIGPEGEGWWREDGEDERAHSIAAHDPPLMTSSSPLTHKQTQASSACAPTSAWTRRTAR
jgi:hypothetical protein